MTDQIMVGVKRPAMGCEFELILCGSDRRHLLDAADEAFEEVERLEQQMSVFIPTSEISYINSVASSEVVRVEPRLFGLLLKAQRLSTDTGGAFDVGIGALIELWSRSNGIPSSETIERTLAISGMANVLLDEDECAIRFSKSGVRLNLGALGKAYAIQQVARLLVERGVVSGLLSAGSSTVFALGTPPDDDAWTVGISDPTRQRERLTTCRLRDQALSTSGSHERYVEIDGVRYSHVIDPRTGWPVKGPLAASAVTTDPVESDALSTAFFILGPERTREYCDDHINVGAILITEDESDSTPNITRIGMQQESEVFNS